MIGVYKALQGLCNSNNIQSIMNDILINTEPYNMYTQRVCTTIITHTRS